MTEERDLGGRLVEGITVTGLTQQRAGQTAEAIENLLAAIEGAKMSLEDPEETASEKINGALADLHMAILPYNESLLNDLIEALRAVERGSKIEPHKRKKPRY